MAEPLLVVAQNPWLLAAQARDEGILDQVEFADSDLVPEDRVFLIDREALLWLPDPADPSLPNPDPED